MPIHARVPMACGLGRCRRRGRSASLRLVGGFRAKIPIVYTDARKPQGQALELDACSTGCPTLLSGVGAGEGGSKYNVL